MLLVVMALVMAAVMLAMVMPAMAKVFPENPGQNGGGPPTASGGIGGAVDEKNNGSIVLHRVGKEEKTCVGHFEDKGAEITKKTGHCPPPQP
jgi:hypothetical protein